MTETLHNAPIVLDNGSGTIRAGFAGEDLPKCYFPSFVGRPKHTRVLAGALEGDVFIGQRAQELRGLLKIRYPLEHGIVTDWDDMERIWQFVYTEELKTLSEEVWSLTRLTDHPPAAEASWLMSCDSYIASRFTHRTASESADKSRYCRSDTVRNFQCTSTLYVNTSSSFALCIRTNNWNSFGFRRWGFACSTRLRGIRYA